MTASNRIDDQETLRQIWRTYRESGSDELREKLILHYAPLVDKIVGHMGLVPDGAIEWEDLINYGILGLIDAIERFDPSRGVKFSTFANLRIRGSVIDALRQFDPLGRVARRRVRESYEAIQNLTVQLGRAPEDTEVAEEIGVTEEQYQQVLQDAGFMMLSLDQPLAQSGDAQNLRLGDSLQDPDATNTLEQVEESELQERLMKALQSLPEREQVLLSLYYHEDLTMREVATVMDISQTRVCQLHSRAVMTLKALLQPPAPDKATPSAESSKPQPDTTVDSGQEMSPAVVDRRRSAYKARKRWAELFDVDL